MSLATTLTLLCALSLFFGAAGAGRLSPGRRSQHHLHRAHHLRRLHHQRVQRELHRPRARDRPADAAYRALLSRHVSGADVRDEPGAGRQQYRPDVGGDRAGDADHGADGRHLPHPRGARGGVEIFHPRQRRHRARAVRHHPRLHGGAAGDRRRPRRHGVDRAGHAAPATSIRRCSIVAFVFLLLGYGTKVGLAPLHAWLPDAHAEGPTPISAVLSGLLLNVALYALLRFKMLLAANAARAGARPADGDAGADLARVRGVHALPPPRHQTPVRLFVDRAHGHHHLRLRHGRPARQFRRAPAHDHAFADQVGDLLRRRPYRAGQGHAAHRRHRRPHRDPSGARLGPRPRRRRHRRPAAARHLHERIPGGELDLRPRAAAGASCWSSACWSALGALFLRLNSIAFGEPRGRSAEAQASYVPMFAHLALVLAAGIYLPPALVAWFQHVAGLLG